MTKKIFLAQSVILLPQTDGHMQTLFTLTFELLGCSLADVFSVPMDADCHDGVHASV